MKKLTIILTYHNEGQEPVNTIQSIINTAPKELYQIIAVDDCSTEVTIGIEQLPNVHYVRNTKRLGCPGSREVGVLLTNTPYILIIDAHMRFRQDNWCEKIIHALEREPQTAFGVTCLIMKKDSESDVIYINKEIKGFGASLHIRRESELTSIQGKHILATTWNRTIPSNSEISCLFGACYAFDKTFYKKIRGLEGLRMYGGDEQYISIKAWLAGGKCKILSQIEVAHLFRDEFPYPLPGYFHIYNKLLIINTLLPDELGRKLISLFPNSVELEWAKMLLVHNRQMVNELKEYYKKTFPNSFNEYCQQFNIKLP